MVAKRTGPRIDEMRHRMPAELIDEHIAVVGPVNSGKTFLCEALAARFHDGGRGNTVIISSYAGRHRKEMKGSPEQHTITLYDGYLPAQALPALRCISTDSLG